MQQYLKLLNSILCEGVKKEDRTGTGTLSKFGYQMRFNLALGFPLVTTKRVHLRSIIYELLWLLRGSGNTAFLKNNKVTIWDEWADSNGDLGNVYPVQWRSYPTRDGGSIDQISKVIAQIRADPDSRRHIVTAWNPGDLATMALPPCHVLFQFYVAEGKLSCLLYQRSADAFLGLPFNIASYALLTQMVAQQCGLNLGEFIWTGGDCHLYINHLTQARLQVTRQPYSLPRLVLKQKPTIFDYCYEDFELVGYQYHEKIAAVVSV